MIERPSFSGWNLDNTYRRLPAFFFSDQAPTPVRSPRLVLWNEAVAEQLGLCFEAGAERWTPWLAGNELPPGAEPVAQAYAGHQFGHFAVLGDGRAILLGEQLTPSGQRVDVQLKGSGQTPYSRRGDGRAALGPMLREYIISEAMHALGIPTTRSLAVVATGEPVYRETALPGAVLTRIAASHIRVGTFEYAGVLGDGALLKNLADYTIQRHYPQCAQASSPYLALLQAVSEAQARLVARWQLVGFIHGVMNTDNMSMAGETIDYGPCAFMDVYHPQTVFSSIDHQGRYAYGNQPLMAQWNLARLTEALLPLLRPDAEEALQAGRTVVFQFPELLQRFWLSGMRAKLGLLTSEEDDVLLVEGLLGWMQSTQRDFTHTFRLLASAQLPEQPWFQSAVFQAWYIQWQARLSRQPHPWEESREQMNRHNPLIVPRNVWVEKALQAATESGDLAPLHQLLAALKRPYEEVSEHEAYFLPPPPCSEPYRTFCGT